jgi:hypothetical protein
MNNGNEEGTTGETSGQDAIEKGKPAKEPVRFTSATIEEGDPCITEDGRSGWIAGSGRGFTCVVQ